MSNQISIKLKYYSIFLHRLAIIEQENRQIEREIAEISNQTKIDETKSIKSISEDIDTSPQLNTGHRRVPGSILTSFFF
jgi:hypothetical protein